MFHSKLTIYKFQKPLFLTIAFIVLSKAAWISDDALITFRVISNFIDGNGPVFNIGERVQAYTHPLWFLLNSVPYYFTHDAFFTPILLALSTTLIVFNVFANRLRTEPFTLSLAFLFLLNSKAFVDYSSSGLENPLTYLLLTLFFFEAFSRGLSSNWYKICILASALCLNRYDSILLIAPLFLYLLIKKFRLKQYKSLIIGLSIAGIPIVAWFGFSLIYYGTIFPNTAYAKLNTGIRSNDLALQGLLYLLDFIQRDPVGFFIVSLGSLSAFIWKRLDLWLATAGIYLSIFYTIKIGGDFMSGRFFTASILVSALILIKAAGPFIKKSKFIVLVISLSLMISLIANNLFLATPKGPFINHSGIADERGYYHVYRGLMADTLTRKGVLYRPHSECQQENPKVETLCGALGMRSYNACANQIFIDSCGLADPFLARQKIPSETRAENSWRIGHFERMVPNEYIESRLTKENKFQSSDPLHRSLDEVILVTQKPIFTDDRIKLIFGFQWGTNH